MGFVAEPDLQGITVDGVYYSADSSDRWPAFYDRLVDKEGVLVGMRVLVLSSAVRSKIPRTSYFVFAEEFDDIDILFFDTLAERPSVEVIQGFGGQTFHSESGQLAMSFDLNWVAETDADRDSIRRANARWVYID
ncbi:MAG: hypothetical protein ABR543_15440 [Gemmatimonadaceae bacterium]